MLSVGVTQQDRNMAKETKIETEIGTGIEVAAAQTRDGEENRKEALVRAAMLASQPRLRAECLECRACQVFFHKWVWECLALLPAFSHPCGLAGLLDFQCQAQIQSQAKKVAERKRVEIAAEVVVPNMFAYLALSWAESSVSKE